jgi:hypothetical protein
VASKRSFFFISLKWNQNPEMKLGTRETRDQGN